MNYSFNGIGDVTATFGAANGTAIAAGTPVKMSGNGEVTACAANDAFIGISCGSRGGHVAGQRAGTAEVAYTGNVSVGSVQLKADGAGGVCPGTGRVCLVIAAADGKAVIML